MRKNKQGAVGALVPFVITLVVVGFIVAIGLTMFSELSDTMTDDSFAQNATDTLTEETAGIADWYGIIVLSIIALVVLTIVMVIRSRAEKA